MHSLKTLLVAVFVLSLTGTGVAAGVMEEFGKFPVSKVDGPAARSSQGLLDCSNAIDVELHDYRTIIHGSNVGAVNNVSTYGCSTWNESGGEVVYRVTFPANTDWYVDLSDMSADLDLAVLDMCDESLGCLIVVDSGVYSSRHRAGEFILVVDGYNGAAGDFTMTIRTPFYPPPPPPMCFLIRDVTGTSFTGDTCDSYNIVTSDDCGAYTEEGLEHYYEIQVPAGCCFTANVTFDLEDGALWVLDRCTGGYACLGYADDTLEGELETVTYTNPTGAAQAVILVVDAWGTGACGTYRFQLVTDCAVATEVASFGGVKAMFR